MIIMTFIGRYLMDTLRLCYMAFATFRGVRAMTQAEKFKAEDRRMCCEWIAYMKTVTDETSTYVVMAKYHEIFKTGV